MAANRRSFGMGASPFLEGSCGLRPEAGLLAPGFAWPRLPGTTWSLQWHCVAAGLAGNSGGTPPDSPRPSLTHRPDVGPTDIREEGRAPRPAIAAGRAAAIAAT